MPLMLALILVGLIAAALLVTCIALWTGDDPEDYVFDDIAEYR